MVDVPQRMRFQEELRKAIESNRRPWSGTATIERREVEEIGASLGMTVGARAPGLQKLARVAFSGSNRGRSPVQPLGTPSVSRRVLPIKATKKSVVPNHL
jgi:hypothetical protein